MEINVIFVGGIHGVGKSTFCNKLLENSNKNIVYQSCSNLLRLYKDLEYKENKSVKNVDENQQILLEAVEKFMDNSNLYILDGHFCLINSKNEITNVPIQLFEKLRPKLMIILKINAEIICNRLKIRDKKNYSLDFIKKFQEKEIKRARYISENLNIKLKEIDLNLPYDIDVDSFI